MLVGVRGLVIGVPGFSSSFFADGVEAFDEALLLGERGPGGKGPPESWGIPTKCGSFFIPILLSIPFSLGEC